ncbi:MAG: hypothetical protein RRY34_00755 [Victivallaceae bacterium]
MRKILFALLAVIGTAVFLIPCTVQAEIEVTKAASEFKGNPKLHFVANDRSSEAAKATYSMLKAADWFDIVPESAPADYIFNLDISGNRVTYTITNSVSGKKYSVAFPVNSRLEDNVKRGIDMLLKSIFGIDGICQSKLAYTVMTGSGKGNIFMCDINGGNVKQITRMTTLCVEPEFTPDGKSILYTRYGQSGTGIYQTKLNPVMTRRIASYKGLNSGAAVHPNGQYLALVLSRDNRVELYTHALGDSGKKRITNDSAVEASPTWSPDGNRICFVSDRIGRPRLYITGANGGSVEKLDTFGIEAVSPAWSKANEIAYIARKDGVYSVVVYNLKTKVNRIVSDGRSNYESVTWAPDNRHLVCARLAGGRGELVIFDTWSGGARVLRRDGKSISSPTWSNLLK